MDPDAFPHHRVPDIPANRFHGHLLISDQVSTKDIGVIWRELEGVLAADVPGAIAEFGCYAGTASLFIRRLLDERRESEAREFHVYDSFAGLPPKISADQSAGGIAFAEGKLSVSKKEFLRQFRIAHLQPPIIHKGWFEELTDADVPEQIAFAFLDGDFYNSILTSLRLVWPRLSRGGTVLIDDYQRPELPGPERAVQDFFREKPQPRIRMEQNIAIIKPL
jgi:O-methyltransferase